MISVEGEVVRREEGTVNPKLAHGRDRARRSPSAERLAESPTPPFPIDEDEEVDELLRLRHRMLDLRREPMQETHPLRHTIVRAMRDYLNARDFLDIETPILTALHARGRARLPRARRACGRARSTRCRSRRSCSSSC